MGNIAAAGNERKLIFAALIFMASFAANANDSRCIAPPYGDTQDNYNKLHAAGVNLPNVRSAILQASLHAACDAKFGHDDDRKMFYKEGFGDRAIDSLGTIDLALAYMASRDKALEKEFAEDHQEEAAPPKPVMNQFVAVMCYDGRCQAFGDTHNVANNVFESMPFRTLADCRQYVYRASMGHHSGSDGRTVIDAHQYWECRGKHVDTWEPTH